MKRERLEAIDSALQTAALLIEPNAKPKPDERTYQGTLLRAYFEVRAELVRLKGWRP